MNKLRKGDIVQIIAGKDSGKKGEILSFVLKDGHQRVVVKGINIVKRARKANPQLGIEGGISQIEKGVDISNVMLVDSKTDKPTRVRIETDKKTGKKSRVSVKTGKEL